MSEDYIDCYYSRTLNDEVSYSSLQDDVDTQVCIIGGGLAGIATALGLVERGKKVVVLESDKIGYGASGRNGGFVLSGFACSYKNILKKVGLEDTKALYGLTKDAQKLIRNRIKTHKIKCDPLDGHLIASWFEDSSSLDARREFYNEHFSENLESWPKKKMESVLKTDCYFDGLFCPDDFHMHPLNYLRSCAEIAYKKGALIFEKSRAIDYKETVSGLHVFTDKGTVRADHIVFCGSAYFNDLQKNLKRSCLPVRTYVVKTEPISEDLLKETISVPYAIRDTRWADDYYRILPDNSILWGGRVGLGSAPNNLDELMLSDMKKIYPQLKNVKAEVSWSGLMGYSVHQMPHIGRFQDNIWFNTNFGGNGVGPTTAGAEVIASAIAEQDERYRLFKPFGFAYTGGPAGPLMAQAIYYGWEIADWIRNLQNRKKAA